MYKSYKKFMKLKDQFKNRINKQVILSQIKFKFESNKPWNLWWWCKDFDPFQYRSTKSSKDSTKRIWVKFLQRCCSWLVVDSLKTEKIKDQHLRSNDETHSKFNMFRFRKSFKLILIIFIQLPITRSVVLLQIHRWRGIFCS